MKQVQIVQTHKSNSAITFLTGLVLAGLTCGSVYAADQAEIMDQLQVVAIKSIKMERKDGHYVATVGVAFANGSNRNLKLVKGYFDFGIKGGDQETFIGRSQKLDLLLPAAKENKPTVTEYTLNMTIGEDHNSTFTRILEIFNLVANPKQTITLSLTGECNLGQEVTNGWVYSKSKLVELKFTPKLQNEVLFQ